MGEPQFAWNTIPLAYAMDTRAMPVGWDGLEAPDAVNVGNPHVVFFVPDAATIELAQLGPIIETDPLFPEGVNVNVASITDGGIASARLGTRCGADARVRHRRLRHGGRRHPARAGRRRPSTVTLPGGTLTIAWQEGGTITMTGPAQESFRGTLTGRLRVSACESSRSAVGSISPKANASATCWRARTMSSPSTAAPSPPKRCARPGRPSAAPAATGPMRACW